jgi:hypothetical protein
MTKQEYQRKYYKDNRQMFLDAAMKSTYGLTRAQYDEMIAAQDNKCKLCGSPGCSGKRQQKLYVDHIEEQGIIKIRGLLCHKCNCALGMLGDNEEGLARALGYVRGQWSFVQGAAGLRGFHEVRRVRARDRRAGRVRKNYSVHPGTSPEGMQPTEST